MYLFAGVLVPAKRNSVVQWHPLSFFFLAGCPTKNGLPQKGFPLFSRVTEQLRKRYVGGFLGRRTWWASCCGSGSRASPGRCFAATAGGDKSWARTRTRPRPKNWAGGRGVPSGGCPAVHVRSCLKAGSLKATIFLSLRLYTNMRYLPSKQDTPMLPTSLAWPI